MDSNTNQLPIDGFLCLSQILGNPKAKPNPILPILPISRSSWYAGIQKGKFPKPVCRGRSATVWKVSDIRRLLAEIETGGLSQ